MAADYKGYRIEANSRKDESARLGKAVFTIKNSDGTLAFYLDFYVHELARESYWPGQDVEDVAMREGERKVHDVIDSGRFDPGRKLICKVFTHEAD